MPEIAPRLPCPVCLGTTLAKAAVGPGGALVVDHCGRCGGVWLEHGEVQRLRTLKAAELWRHVEKRGQPFRMRCHDCHAPMERGEARCPSCGWKNALDCPACQRPMRTESHRGLLLDLCRDCKGVWFDHHELEAIWGERFDQALRKRGLSRGISPGRAGYGAGDAALDTLFFAPELLYFGAHAAGHAAGHAVAASAHVASRVPEAIGAAPEAASSVFEAIGEAAGSVFEVTVEIIGGIFDAF